jgi:hypothetical protein
MPRRAAPADDSTMLHVRVVSPADLTAGVVDLLAANPGVDNLVVLPGVVRKPAGDAVQFDLSGLAANAVLGQLRGLQADHLGPIVIESVDAAIGAGQRGQPGGASGHGASGHGASDHRASDRGASDHRASYHGETAPVWDLVESKIAADSVYAPSFFILLALAGLIGAASRCWRGSSASCR